LKSNLKTAVKYFIDIKNVKVAIVSVGEYFTAVFSYFGVL